MRTIISLCATLTLLLAMMQGFAQDTCVAWTFPLNPDDSIADAGIPANLTRYITTGGGTSNVDFATVGFSTNAANATGWNDGANAKYWIISFNSVGYTTLNLYSKQRSANTGPRNFKIQYSLDTAAGWTDVVLGTVVVANNWTGGFVNNLALPVACTNQPLVYIRWIMTDNISVTGGTVASGGTSRIDDILVLGSSSYVPAYAALPYSMNFDNIWIDGNDNQDIPSTNWLNTPEMGDESWRREDNTSSWSSGTGAYTPSGASGSAHSARFHTWDVQWGLFGNLDLYVNCSAPGLKVLTFYYINNSGSDHITIQFSTNGGLSFTDLDSVFTAGNWSQQSISLGNTTSATCVVRFHGVSDWGNDDMGIDQVTIGPPPAVDAGIESIVAPPSSVPGGNYQVKANLMNYGTDPLTSTTIRWTVNGVLQSNLPWNGALASGAVDDSLVLGTYNFTAGVYQIRAWTTNPNGGTDGDITNDTAYHTVTVNAFATIPFYEGFDGAWIDKNDLVDVPSIFWVNTPFDGNNSWRRDDEGDFANWATSTNGAYTPTGASSTSHSARFHSYNASMGDQGMLDLNINLSTSGPKTLRYYIINTTGTDQLDVMLSTDGGMTFNLIATQILATVWTQYSVSLGSTTAPNAIIRFMATSDFGFTDFGLDEVTVDLSGHDVGIVDILQPVGGCNLSATEPMQVRVTNVGAQAESNIPLTFRVNTNNYTGTLAGPLNPGDTVTFTFSQTANLSIPGTYSCRAYTGLGSDTQHTNDTIVRQIMSTTDITAFPFLEDFESGNMYFSFFDTVNSGIFLQAGIGNTASIGLRMTGGDQSIWAAGTGNSTTANEAWNIYADHHAAAYTCTVDATSLSNPELLLDLKQDFTSGPLYSWFRVMINDTAQIPSTLGTSDFNPITNTDPYKTQTFDLTAFAGTVFTLKLEASCKYDSAIGGLGDNVYVDNLILRDKPLDDIAALKWEAPIGGECNMGSDSVALVITNAGVNPQVNFPVSYSIDGGANWITENVPDSIFAGDTMTYVFSTLADFSTPGAYNCIGTGSLPGDDYVLNDTTFFTVISVPQVATFPYIENFEGFSGWSTGPVWADNWELGIPNKAQLNSAHSGVKSWVTLLDGNYPDNADCWLVSPCLDFSSLTDPRLSVWLNINCEYGWDALVMETTFDGITWTQYPGDLTFYNNNEAYGNVLPPKWSGSNSGWTKYQTTMTGFAGEPYVRIRFRFNSDFTVNGEGVALDDLFISDPLPYNAAVTKLLSPEDGCGLGNNETVTVTVFNDGTQSLSNIPIGFSVDGGTWVNETVSGPIASGDTMNYTFTAGGNFTGNGAHTVRVAVAYAQDLDPTNDTLVGTVTTLNSITAVTYSEDFESGNPTFEMFASTLADVMLTLGEGDLGSTALHFTGGSSSGTWPGGTANSTTAAEAWDLYTDHHAFASTCNINISGPDALFLRFLLRQSHSGSGPKYSWFRVLANDSIALTDTNGVTDFNPFTEMYDSAYLVVYDLTSYIGNTFNIVMQSCNKYNAASATNWYGDNAFVDNVVLYDPGFPPGFDESPVFLPMVYPNPTNDKVTILFNTTLNKGSLRVIDNNGKLCRSAAINGTDRMEVDLSTLPAGLYCILIQTGSESATIKIIKE